MLDLSKHTNKYSLIWFDKQELHLDMPSQELLLKIMKLERVENEAEQFEMLIDILGDILNKNDEGRVFTKEEIKSIPLNIIELIFTDYVNSINQSLGE